MVFQHLKADIAQVLVGDVAEQFHRLDFAVFALGIFHEVGDGLPVAPGLFIDTAEGFVTRIHDHIHLGFLAVGDIGVAQRVFVGHAAVVLDTHFIRHLRQNTGRGGRHHVKLKDIALALLVVKRDGDVVLFT